MGIRVSGGGSIEVDTESMIAAARTLAGTTAALDGLRGRIAACLTDPGWRSVPAAGARISVAVDAAGEAARASAAASSGLHTAAVRYGATEHALVDAQRAVWAGAAAGLGTATRIGTVVIGPGAPVLVGGAVLGLAAAALGVEALRELLTTGTVQPQLDPDALAVLRLTLSSLDDTARGFLLTERPDDLLVEDPAAPFGTESIAAGLAGLLPVGDAPIRLLARELGSVDGPHDLVGLAARIPSADAGGEQLRIERYPGGSGDRWIVYIGGTVTFAPDSGPEPFDLASDLGGVGHAPTASETAVLQAMHEAGVGADEPVLLVGHSQGALDAARVAQDGGFHVGGVVQVGGPSGQIVLPADVPVLSVEHDEDPVPVLGGVAAAGSAGLRRVVVSRSLPRGGVTGFPAPFAGGVPSHGMPAYSETLRQAEAAHEPRVDGFTEQIRPFLDAEGGTGRALRADREVSPVRGPRAGGGPGR